MTELTPATMKRIVLIVVNKHKWSLRFYSRPRANQKCALLVDGEDTFRADSMQAACAIIKLLGIILNADFINVQEKRSILTLVREDYRHKWE